MIQKPKVSVVIPVYAVEQYIERCARSLFEQTLDSIEYLFINDCTPDKSIDILKKILEDYPYRKNQVVIHNMDANSGQAAVRKWGILNASGEYVIHCDSDDWVEATIYEKLYNKAKEENLDVVMCDYYEDNGKDTKKLMKSFNREVEQNDFFKNALLQHIGASLWNKLVRRDLISVDKMIFAPANMGEDYVLVIQYLYYAKHVGVVNEPLYHYYLNDNSITKSLLTDKVIYRFNQSIMNMVAVESFMTREGLVDIYQNELDRLKYYKRNNILPIISERRFYELWKGTFPEINTRILTNPLLTLRGKIKYIMVFLRLKRR